VSELKALYIITYKQYTESVKAAPESVLSSNRENLEGIRTWPGFRREGGYLRKGLSSKGVISVHRQQYRL